jgi:hypothetical protein
VKGRTARLGSSSGLAIVACCVLAIFATTGCGHDERSSTAGQRSVGMARPRPFAVPRKCPIGRAGDGAQENPRGINQLWPSGANRALVCRFERTLPFQTRGHHGSAVQKVSHAERTLDGQMLARLESRMQALEMAAVREEACPEEKTVRYTIGVAYASRPGLVVRVNYAGCSSVSNGAGTRGYQPSTSLTRFLDGLFR